ncbi:MAG: hypothetical protein MUF84_11505 [Anaerolineae bacterium]|nr:hypothetical protein [Anaerolineae bacterium]
MSEDRVTGQESTSEATSEIGEAVAAVVNETVKFVDSLGRALLVAAQDISSLMVIRVDGETREHLDLLVDAGAAKSRRDAAATLLVEGIQAKGATFDRIAQTQAQIKELKQQVRSLIKAPTA